jgi:D-sedoheptulose 7-phosphate isomerase
MGSKPLGSYLTEPETTSEMVDSAAYCSVTQAAVEYVWALEHLLRTIDLDSLERVVAQLSAARANGRTVYVAGNGGSSATASHWANDLGKATKRHGSPAMRVMSLTDNVPWLTALANDEGYERTFSGQLENFAREGDLLVVISASGNSPNLVEAVELGRAAGVVAVGLLGFDGGRLKGMVDHCLWLETDEGEYGLVESGHVVICDILTTCLIAEEAGPGARDR